MKLSSLIQIFLPFSRITGGVVPPPDVPGMEWTLKKNRLHWTMKDRITQWTMPKSRMHWTLPEDDQ
ncbi:MAG: hypothetical protein WC455_11360 [Dehalococcoidia bacterium]|jgi:hypothetical protein